MNLRLFVNLSVLLLISSLLFTQCSSSEKVPKADKQDEKTPDLLVKSATATSWVAGVREGGTGTKYQLDVIVNVDDLKLDYLCTKNALLSFRIVKSDSLQSSSYQIKKGDKLSLRASHRSNELTAVCNDSLAENEVVIHYSISGKEDLALRVKNVIIKQAKPRP